MKLLWSSRSPFVRKVVVVTHELGIADRIELERVNVTASATNAEVMRFNPLNKIPTLLLDDGSVMIDSSSSPNISTRPMAGASCFRAMPSAAGR
jgi:glutathione S-transferase